LIDRKTYLSNKCVCANGVGLKKTLPAVLIIASIIVSATLQVASAVSETIDLPALQTINRNVDLQINDRLTVSVTPNNNESYTVLSARILDPQFRPAASWTNYQNNSFSYIAAELAGNYIIGIVYENNTSSNPISNIEVTLSYGVEHQSATPKPTQTTPEDPQDWTMIIVVVAAVAILVAITVLVLKRRK
jgi:hypothetical protein